MLGRSLPHWLYSLALTALASACAAEDRASSASLDDRSGREMSSSSDGCATPNTGCGCVQEGASVQCGTVKEKVGKYTLCSKGVRVCSGGTWSACAASHDEAPEVSSSEADAGAP
jgi:hypothetical protein